MQPSAPLASVLPPATAAPILDQIHSARTPTPDDTDMTDLTGNGPVSGTNTRTMPLDDTASESSFSGFSPLKSNLKVTTKPNRVVPQIKGPVPKQKKSSAAP